MRSREEVALVLALAAKGRSATEIARAAGVPRGTVRDWMDGRTPDFDRMRLSPRRRTCPVCAGRPRALPEEAYSYLLGLYLGDGCLSWHPRGVWHLRIACANRYPGLMSQCEAAMAKVLPVKVGRVRCQGYISVNSYSKHWICLFPQHGLGRKHERRIELVPWQQEIVDQDPRPLIKGLLHSDGCRVLNWVNGTPYPRYHFDNVSDDIRAIFGRACDQLGVEWRHNNRTSISVARRASVALLDEFVGPKH
jgi:hypothetical protein